MHPREGIDPESTGCLERLLATVDEARSRIVEDLRDLVEGELAFDPIARAPYRGDSGLYEVDPLGAVAPRSEQDLRALVRYAQERGLILHPRGAGTGGRGGCLGPGLIVDLSRHFRHVDVEGEEVVADAGAPLGLVNRRLAEHGRRLGVDPIQGEVATIGGLIGRDAVGPRSLRFGPFADQVVAARGVFANGEPAQLSVVVAPDDERDPINGVEDIARRLSLLVTWHAEMIAREVRRAARLGHGLGLGYRLDALRDPARFDLARLVCGAQGTLAIVTQARLRTQPLPESVSVVVLAFHRLADAAEAIPLCLASRPTSCELFDGRILTIAREVDPAWHLPLPETCEAALVVGFEEEGKPEAADRARRLADRAALQLPLRSEPYETHAAEEARHLLRLRELIEPALMRLRGQARLVTVCDAIQTPLDALPSLLIRLQNVMRQHASTGTIDAHAGLGRVRFRVFLDLANPEDREKFERIADTAAVLAADLGGVSPTGRGPLEAVRARWVPSELLNLFREIKAAFDPRGLLNPDPLLEPNAQAHAAWMRALPSASELDRLVENDQAGSMVLRWLDRDRAAHVSACNGCGACRSQSPLARMCPVFRATRDEAHAPRGKLRVLEEIAAGRLDPRGWGSESMRTHAELCVHCKLCQSECPSGVDVSGLMLEAKAAFVANHGLTPEDWMVSRIDTWAAWSTRIPNFFNMMMRSRFARWALERAFGLSRFRDLPLAQPNAYLKQAEREGLTRAQPHQPGPRAAYFLDFFTNHFDPELAAAVVGVLRHLGVNVYVPRGQAGSGMPALITGDIDRARELVLRNLRPLSNAVRDGYTIVCSEPTALLMLREEALRLTSDLDASLVADNCMDVGAYVLGLLNRGDVPAPHAAIDAKVGYHQPCHLRALNAGQPALALFAKIPGLEWEFIDRGCSGMAGIFGLSARHFRMSLRAGRALTQRLASPEFLIGSTECTACRMQMEQGGRKRTIHPMKLLALAYGLNPALERHLLEPKPRRALSS